MNSQTGFLMKIYGKKLRIKTGFELLDILRSKNHNLRNTVLIFALKLLCDV